MGVKDLGTLVAALQHGKLVTALEGKGPFTVFAPTNEAFAKLPADLLNKLLEPKNIKQLQSVLEYHVVSGAAVYSKDLHPVNHVKTLEGEKLLVEVLHPCSVDKIPKSYQLQYRFEFAALDKNHNGYLNPGEFKSKGVQIAKTFQNYRGNPDDKKKGRGGRQLAKSSFWDNLRKRFQDRWKARQEANMAQGVFNKADKDNSKQLSLCEYSNAMYSAQKQADMFGGNDGPVVVHG